jgi:hypothetical protein
MWFSGDSAQKKQTADWLCEDMRFICRKDKREVIFYVLLTNVFDRVFANCAERALKDLELAAEVYLIKVCLQLVPLVVQSLICPP